MGNKIFKDITVKVDAPNSTGVLALVDITSYLSSASLRWYCTAGPARLQLS